MKIQILTLFVFSLFMAACDNSAKPELAPETIFETSGMQPITSLFNKKSGTMSTLYGNDLALKAARDENQNHRPGEVFTLVTWDLEPNPYWFGGNINGDERYIETVKVLPAENGIRVDYEVEKNGGDVFKTYNTDKQERINFIFEQKAAVFP